MHPIVKYLFLALLCMHCLGASAQNYTAALRTLRAKSDDAMEKHNIPLYSKLVREEYALTTQHKDTAEMIRTCVKLVDFFTFVQLNYDSANLYRNRGIYWAQLKKDIERETDLRYMQAAQYVNDGKYVEAYALFQKLDSVVAANDFGFAPLFNNTYAYLLSELKEGKKALERMKLAAKGFEKEKDIQSVSIVYCNIAGEYFKADRLDSTFVYLNKALKINKSINDTVAIAECYTRLGLIYSRQGNNEKALELFKTAFEYNPVSPTDFLMTNYTDVLTSVGKFKEAENILFDLKKDPKIQTQLIAIKSLIALKKKEKKYEEALAYSEEYNERDQELLNIDKIKEIEELQTQYDVATKENEITLLHERNAHQAKTLFQNRIILYVSIGLSLMMLLAVFLMFRNRAIRLKAEQILLEQQLLRLQMNPHFIFNSLTNIQSTILQKEHIKAAGYIATFSKLVRNILENSVQSKVTFANELSALKDYMSLQKIRYGEQLNYEIEVDEDIEEDIITIPPMLFQPIVENAIEHGIAEKTDGFIHIHFSQFDKHIHCTITDNGVGYGNNVKSSEPAKEKTSLSTQITKRRLALLSKKFTKQTLDYRVTVLKGENGVVTGTKVEIDLPILS